MLLIDNYSVQNHKNPNYALLKRIDESDLTMKVASFTVPTTPPDKFESYTPGELRNIFDNQTSQMEKELQILLKYGLISKSESEKTRQQYEKLYFDDGFVYIKDDLFDQSTNDRRQNTTTKHPDTTPENFSPNEIPPSSTLTGKQKRFDLPTEDDEESFLEDERDTPRSIFTRSAHNSNVIGISKQAIRDITTYSYTVRMPWHSIDVTIEWQKELIEAEENIIVVDGSRQGGKSLTIAEKIIEESFLPGKDIMVAAFLQETTESIGEYMLDFMENFDDGTFTVKERKRYIQNNDSGVRIHFRTLKDGAKGIRGKTLRMIVVDEAMLVPTNVFKSVLLPTQTTIENPKLILLGTASEDTSCYMYKVITNIKKGTIYNNKGQRTARHIRFSVLENPLVSPIMKQEILDDRDAPTTKREYFNTWGKLEDSLFQPKHISILAVANDLNQQAHILLAMDPARKQDRSAFAVGHCLNGKVILLATGEVPMAWKNDWSLQGKFFQNISSQYIKYKSFSATIDCTGVGDGVVHIWQKMGIPIQDKIRYTAGDSESLQGENEYMVGKSLLINNMIDMISEGTLIVPYEWNPLFLEEIEFIQATQTRNGKLSFRSDYFDDVTNAVMILLYTARKRGFINRVAISTEKELTFDSELKTYEPKHPKWSRQRQSSGW